MAYTYHTVTRSQHAVGSGVAHGPDMYMAVVAIPDGSEWTPDRYLRRDTMRRHGVRYWYIGAYYGEHTGPRSAYHRLDVEADALTARQSALDLARLAHTRGGASDPARGWEDQEAA